MPPARSGTSPPGTGGCTPRRACRSASRGDRIGRPACRSTRRFLLACVLLRAMCPGPAEDDQAIAVGRGVVDGIGPAAEDPGRVDDARPSGSRNITPPLAFQYGCGAATGVNPALSRGSSAAQGRCRRRIEDDLLEPVCAGVAALGAHDLHVVVMSGSPNMVPSFP